MMNDMMDSYPLIASITIIIILPLLIPLSFFPLSLPLPITKGQGREKHQSRIAAQRGKQGEKTKSEWPLFLSLP